MSSDGSKARTYLKYSIPSSTNLNSIAPKSTRPWFTCTELASIYNCPLPPTLSNTIGVISLGGGLYGDLNPSTGILTNGDIQKCWTDMGIATSNQPKVIIKTLGGSVNSPSSNTNSCEYEASIENTVDVTTIGAWYPSSNLTIIMYLVNQYSVNNSFYTALDYAINSNVVSGSNTYRSPTISVSWGFPEIYNTNILIQTASLFSNAAINGINIFCATGNGVLGINNYTDFPASSPYVIACGGTRLVSQNLTYDNSTVETTWSGGRGGISRIFSKPSYQSNVTLSATNRCTPDIALNADPDTGVYYIYNNNLILVGGTGIVSPAMSALTAALNIKYFLNNKLYRIGSNVFNNIIQRNNGGYNTGLGSVNGINLKGALLSVETTGIIITPNTRSLKPKTNFQFIATVQPTNSTNKTLNWSSSNPKVASISASGLCTAKSLGNTVITVSQENIRVSATVSVKEKLSKDMNLTIKIDEIYKVNLISKNDTTEYNIINNYNSIVNSVFNDGAITIIGKNIGKASIIIQDDYGKEHGVLNINVV